MNGILGIVDLAMGAIGDAIRRHAVASEEMQAQIEADMLAAIKAMHANFADKDQAHEKRWWELEKELETKLAKAKDDTPVVPSQLALPVDGK